MEKKVKMGVSALTIVTIVFMVLGGTFFPVGILMFVLGLKVDSEMFIMAIIFGSVGTLFLALGLLFLFMELKKRKVYNRLLQEGYYILAEVVEIDRNLSVSYGNTSTVGGGRHPYIIKCEYMDENSTIHIFSSRNITKYPGSDLLGRQVRVYVDRNDYGNFKHYYVDVDELIGNVVEH